MNIIKLLSLLPLKLDDFKTRWVSDEGFAALLHDFKSKNKDIPFESCELLQAAAVYNRNILLRFYENGVIGNLLKDEAVNKRQIAGNVEGELADYKDFFNRFLERDLIDKVLVLIQSKRFEDLFLLWNYKVLFSEWFVDSTHQTMEIHIAELNILVEDGKGLEQVEIKDSYFYKFVNLLKSEKIDLALYKLHQSFAERFNKNTHNKLYQTALIEFNNYTALNEPLKLAIQDYLPKALAAKDRDSRPMVDEEEESYKEASPIKKFFIVLLSILFIIRIIIRLFALFDS